MRTSKKGIPFRQRGKELRPFRALYRDLRRIEFWPDGEDGEMRIGWIEKSTRWSMGTTLDAYIPCDDDGEQHPDYVSPGGFGARAKRNAPQTLLHAVDDLVTLLAEQRENAA